MNHTFKSIAKDAGVGVRTVRHWWKKHQGSTDVELGEIKNGTRIFTDEEKYVLQGYGRPIEEKVEMVDDAEPLETAAIVELEGSQFSTAIAASRFDGAVGQLMENPEQAVEIVDMLCSNVLGALENKVQEQQQAIAQTQQAQWQVEAKQEAFLESATKLGVKSKTLADRQTATTEALQAKLAEMLELGKQS